MATAKSKTKKKVGWKSSKGNPAFTELGLRVSVEDADLIQAAVESEASRLRFAITSRNNFCVRAVVAAAKKELDLKS